MPTRIWGLRRPARRFAGRRAPDQAPSKTDEFENSRLLRPIMPFQNPRRIGRLYDERMQYLRQIAVVVFVCYLFAHDLPPAAFLLLIFATDLCRKPSITSCR